MELIKSEIFSETNTALRVYGTAEEPWFVAKEVLSILGINNSPNNLKSIPEKYRILVPLTTPGGVQKMTLINECGLYKLILRSNKLSAEKFQSWVLEDVLPSIRKTGKYSVTKTNYNTFDYYFQSMEELEKLNLPEDIHNVFVTELTKDMDNQKNSYIDNLTRVTNLLGKKWQSSVTTTFLNKLYSEMRSQQNLENKVEVAENFKIETYDESYKETLKDNSFWGK